MSVDTSVEDASFHRDLKAVDLSNYHGESYLRAVFFRDQRVRGLISRRKWAWLTFVELIVGADLIENISITASALPHKNIRKPDSDEYGLLTTLNNHIPSGVVTNWFRSSIIEILYYKYYGQYLLMWPDSKIVHNDTKPRLDLTRYRFAVGKDRLYQILALRKVYDGTWLVANVSIDILVWLVTQKVETALLSALLIEGVRRALRV